MAGATSQWTGGRLTWINVGAADVLTTVELEDAPADIATDLVDGWIATLERDGEVSFLRRR